MADNNGINSSKFKLPSFRVTVFGLAVAIIIVGGLMLWEERKLNLKKNDLLLAQSNKSTSQNLDIESPALFYDEEEAYKGAGFFEKYPEIGGQQAYIAYPLEVSNGSPTLVIYSHGSNTHVTMDFEDQFMKDLREYARALTQAGFVFAASEEHGANFGNAESVQDIINLIAWVDERYPIAEKMNMIGFSMGGMPTLNYTFENSEMVGKIALLAPTTRPDLWGQSQITSLMNVDLKIWHGDQDMNVPLSSSTAFVALSERYGKNVELEILEGKEHFDVDTEYILEILKFFQDE